jgi:hypothetical protein
MERKGEEKKDHWNWTNEILEDCCQKVQEWIPDRSTKRRKGTKDGVDGLRVTELLRRAERGCPMAWA